MMDISPNYGLFRIHSSGVICMEHIPSIHLSDVDLFFKRAMNNILVSWLACNQPGCNSVYLCSSDVLCFFKTLSLSLNCNLLKSALKCSYCRQALGVYN
jgi:hypothetical protein